MAVGDRALFAAVALPQIENGVNRRHAAETEHENHQRGRHADGHAGEETLPHDRQGDEEYQQVIEERHFCDGQHQPIPEEKEAQQNQEGAKQGRGKQDQEQAADEQNGADHGC